MVDGLVVDGLVKRFGDESAIDGISFRVAAGEIVALLGPSGCGKTTTLRSIAGLETPTHGTIRLDGRTIFSSEDRVDVTPEKRGIGLVFQSYALWPHLTVFENVAYGLRVARVSKAERVARVHDILATVELDGMAERYPSTLSGGQQQRVALARSLVMRPRMLLFDEPLSNLDLKLRESMRQELRHVMKQTGLTCVYVTHDQAEAMVIADRMIVMRAGVIEQEDSPRAIYARPRTAFAAKFVGSVNLLPVAGFHLGDAGAEIETTGGIRLLVEQRPDELPGGQGSSAVVRPEWIRFARPDEESSENILEATVRDVVFLGNITFYDLDCDGLQLRMQSTDADHFEGDRVRIAIPRERIVLVES